MADEEKTDREIADSPHVGSATAERMRKRFAEGGLEDGLRYRAMNREMRAAQIKNAFEVFSPKGVHISE